MPTICDAISADFLNDCDNKPVAGVESIITLINKEDILSVTYDTTNKQVVRSITLKDDTKGYKFEVYKNTHKPKWTSVERSFGMYYKHEIPTAMMKWDIASKVQAEALHGAKVVAIVINLQMTGDARVEIYGWDQGLSAIAGSTRDTAANDGVFNFTLANADEFPEPHLPKTFAVEVSTAYSYSATIAAVEALWVVAG